MDFFIDLLHNRMFMTAALGWITAQILKTLIYLIVEHKFDMERLFGSGGMPSSHSSTVCALATTAANQYGADSFQFAFSAVLAVIVMYDAHNVRLETGKQSKIINEMQQIFESIGKPISAEEKLKELVGHTRLQVFFGALLGILIGLLTQI